MAENYLEWLETRRPHIEDTIRLWLVPLAAQVIWMLLLSLLFYLIPRLL